MPRSNIESFYVAKRKFEQEYCERVLKETGGNVSWAADLAEKDRKDFYDLMFRCGVKPKNFRNGNMPVRTNRRRRYTRRKVAS